MKRWVVARAPASASAPMQEWRIIFCKAADEGGGTSDKVLIGTLHKFTAVQCCNSGRISKKFAEVTISLLPLIGALYFTRCQTLTSCWKPGNRSARIFVFFFKPQGSVIFTIVSLMTSIVLVAIEKAKSNSQNFTQLTQLVCAYPCPQTHLLVLIHLESQWRKVEGHCTAFHNVASPALQCALHHRSFSFIAFFSFQDKVISKVHLSTNRKQVHLSIRPIRRQEQSGDGVKD